MMRVLFPVLFFGGFVGLLSWGVSHGISNLGWPEIGALYFNYGLGVGCVFATMGLYFGIFDRSTRPIDRARWKNLLVGWTGIWVVALVLFSFAHILQFVIGGIGNLLDTSQAWQYYYMSTLLILLGLLLLTMVWGIIWGKYRFTIENVKLEFDDLPKAFDGFRIAQISDAHSGTWDSIAGVQKGIDLLQKQNADLIVFTGDMVNGDKNEVEPFIELFASLRAPHGKYAILGNHDYYGQPREAALRPAYYEEFFDKFRRMGWDLLMNEYRLIKREGSEFALIGVENWGEGRYFPKRGDLNKALTGVSSDGFSILLSHDPTHWDHHVIPNDHHMHLTLSGHTHAMQFGINTPWFKWSPISLRYKKWMGLYKEAGQYLYINRGFGCLAFPGRVGMYPEITVIELRSKKTAEQKA